MYVCGPTVYSDVHLGNVRTFLTFDIVYRYLMYLGYKVRYVRNITDVGHLVGDVDEGEDKIAKKARLENLEPMEVVSKHTNSPVVTPGTAPGPMAFSDRDYLSGILRGAGYQAIEIATQKTTLDTRQSPQEDAVLLMKIGAGARMLFEAEPSKAQVHSVQEDFVRMSAAKRSGGITRYPATIHVVTATA